MAGVALEGFADKKFNALRETVRENFGNRGEVGCAVAVYVDGKPLVDLWGGATVRGGPPSGVSYAGECCSGVVL